MVNIDLFNHNSLHILRAHQFFGAMPSNTSWEFPVCGVGEAHLSLSDAPDFFVLLSTQSLTQVPNDVHAMIVPGEMKIEMKDRLLFSVDDSVGSTLSLKPGDESIREVFVKDPYRHRALWHEILVYKMVGSRFKLMAFDGRPSPKNYF